MLNIRLDNEPLCIELEKATKEISDTFSKLAGSRREFLDVLRQDNDDIDEDSTSEEILKYLSSSARMVAEEAMKVCLAYERWADAAWQAAKEVD